MNPIICVTEFTELTHEAAKVAAAFARRLGERVVLVRSVDEREQFPYRLRLRLMPQDFRRLADEAHHLRQFGFDFEEHVVCGMPEEGISGLAWSSGACLVVVGSRPTATIEHWALGCIAEEISDTSFVPVLAVRSAAALEQWLTGNSPLKVFMAVDPSARPDAMLNRIDELGQMGECTLHASLVPYPERPTFPSPRPATLRHHRLEDAYAARDITLCETRSGRDAAADVVARAVDLHADLLVITSHPGSDLTLLPHPALAHGILRGAPMNVLCVPEPDIEPPHAVPTLSQRRSSQFTHRQLGPGMQTSRHGESR